MDESRCASVRGATLIIVNRVVLGLNRTWIHNARAQPCSTLEGRQKPNVHGIVPRNSEESSSGHPRTGDAPDWNPR